MEVAILKVQVPHPMLYHHFRNKRTQKLQRQEYRDSTAASIIDNKLEHLIKLHIVGKCVTDLVSTSLCIIFSPSLHLLHVSPLQCNKQGKTCDNVAVALPVM